MEHDERVIEFLRDMYPVNVQRERAVGQRTIAAALGISRRAVWESIDRLEQEGRIRVRIPESPVGASGTAHYTLIEEE